MSEKIKNYLQCALEANTKEGKDYWIHAAILEIKLQEIFDQLDALEKKLDEDLELCKSL